MVSRVNRIFGWSTVICGMDIKLKKSSICQALRKRSFMTADVLLVGVGKDSTFGGLTNTMKYW